jgi:hypothetical protein
VISFEIAHDTRSQIDTGLLQTFSKDDTVIGKDVEALEQSQKWPLSLLTLFTPPILHIYQRSLKPYALHLVGG